MRIVIDENERYIEINGIRYANELFEELAFAPVGTKIEIIERGDGVVVCKRLEEGE